jgi:putative endonuclease
MAKRFFVYIMASRSKRLYVGVTSDLTRRVAQHKAELFQGFSAKYQTKSLVFYEETGDSRVAIAREKQLKGWLRKRKIGLIEGMNPEWKDLSSGWGLPNP